MELPNNFNKYLHIINCYGKQGFDCLNSHESCLRMIYDSYKNYYFVERIDDYLIYSVIKRGSVKVPLDTDYNLELVRDETIKHYLTQFLNIKPKPLIKDEIKINCLKLDRNLFNKYCSYHRLLEDYKVDEIEIDVNFNDVVGKYFVDYLTTGKVDKNLLIDSFHFKMFSELLDYLGVEFIKRLN